MSNKKSNVVNFKNEVNKRFNKEKEIKFTLEDKDYKLGTLVHQSGDIHDEEGLEFIFELEEFEDDEPTVHWSWLAKKAVSWRN